MSQQCIHKKKDGKKCKAHSLSGGSLCYVHASPENPKKAGRASGVSRRFKGVTVPGAVTLRKAEDALKLREFVIEGTLQGELPVGVSNSIIYALSGWSRDYELFLMSERIDKLKEVLQGES